MKFQVKTAGAVNFREDFKTSTRTNEIIVQSQRYLGKSNIIISSKITAGDAVRAAQHLTKVV